MSSNSDAPVIPYFNVDAEPITIDALKSYLWGAATLLRGQIDAGSYKEYIFPLLFFKRVSDVYDEEYYSYVKDDGEEYAEVMMQDSPVQIPKGCHWNDVRRCTENVGQKLVECFTRIEQANPPKQIGNRMVGGLTGIFGNKSGWTNKSLMPDHIILSLIEHFSTQLLSMESCPADEMGLAYEYLVGQFANDAGHTAQEFYTNRTVVTLMAEILQPKPYESIYDPTCGTGGMLIKSLTYLKDKGEEWRTVRVFGQELNALTSSIARMNLQLHGIYDYSIVNDDTLLRPAFLDGGALKKFDMVLANPPYSITSWNVDAFRNDVFGRNFLGTPEGRADFAFIQHIIASMNDETGRCAILLPHGVLFRKEEMEMRKKLVETDKLECVIGLGHYLFFNSAMISCVMICRSKKPLNRKGKVLFIDAENEVTRKNAQSYLEDKHINRILNAYNRFEDEYSYCKVADNDTILKNQGKLSIPLYVEGAFDTEEDNSPIEAHFAKWSTNSREMNINMTSLIEML